jgi:exo-beta-1,3-glucanase (GH17 family)
VDAANADVLRAVDFVGTDGYPYWQGATPEQAGSVFWTSVDNVRGAVNNIKVWFSVNENV